MKLIKTRKAIKLFAATGVYLSFLCFAVTAFAGAPQVTRYAVDGNAQLPFSDAVRVGHMLYLSGQLGIDPKTGKLASGGIAAETRQTMENIKSSLEKYGSSMAEIVKCTVFLADIKDWPALNEVYIGYFPGQPPARSALAASGLALGALTEIECMATVE